MEDRIQKAVELFKSGYNCSQSVVAAFADMYGFTQEQLNELLFPADMFVKMADASWEISDTSQAASADRT